MLTILVKHGQLFIPGYDTQVLSAGFKLHWAITTEIHYDYQVAFMSADFLHLKKV